MVRSASKKSVDVTVKIQPGPASVSQRVAWGRFWSGLVAQVTDGRRTISEAVSKGTEE